MSADMTANAAGAAPAPERDGRTPAWPGDPENLAAADIDFEALAHVLANTCRWGGRTRRYHALIASEEIEALDGLGAEDRRTLALHALLMDAPAAWLGGDAPVSQRTGRLAAGIERAVREAAGLDAELAGEHAELLRFIARMTLAAERRDLFDAGDAGPAPGSRLGGRDRSGPGQAWAAFPPLKRRIRPVGPGRAAKLWLARFRALARPPGGAGAGTGTGTGTAAGGNGGPGETTNEGEDSDVADVSAKEGPETRTQAGTPVRTGTPGRAPGRKNERRAA